MTTPDWTAAPTWIRITTENPPQTPCILLDTRRGACLSGVVDDARRISSELWTHWTPFTMPKEEHPAEKAYRESVAWGPCGEAQRIRFMQGWRLGLEWAAEVIPVCNTGFSWPIRDAIRKALLNAAIQTPEK